MIKIALSGAAGRICRTIYKTVIGSDEYKVVFGVDSFPATDLQFPLFKNFDECSEAVDVVLDFSAASSLDGVLAYAERTGAKLVLATTGHSEEQMETIKRAAKNTAVFKASNMSLGVNLLADLSKEAAKFLGDSYDVEIVETHHNLKLDAPSGTALTLANAINEVRGNTLRPTFGRHETAHRREPSEIGIHAVRGGTVVGKHDVMFLGTGEIIKLSHEAESKEVFVRGALRAADFLMNKKTGLYDMNSILGDYYAVTTVTTENGVSLITLPSITKAEFLSLLTGLKDSDVNIDMISQNFNPHGGLTVSFTVNDTELTSVEKLLQSYVKYQTTKGAAKLNVEGAGMEHKSGVALDVLTILGDIGADVYAITTSETKISCCINSGNLANAEKALKSHYGLSK